MKIPHRVEAFILEQPLIEQRQLVKILERIEEDPFIGTYLPPVAYQPGVLGVNLRDKYFITYRIQDDDIDVGTVTHMLDLDSIMEALQQED